MKKKHIHFVGIKGVGMTPLAIIAKEAGAKVSGCDIGEEFITDEALAKAKIDPYQGFSSEHLGDVDMVITTGAHGGFNNPEVIDAKIKGIPIIPQGKALGMVISGELFGKSFTGIGVAGSHGKTTTTGMITTILKEANLAPSWAIGTSDVPSVGLPGHYGKGEYFVAEADEYVTEPTYDKTPKFAWLTPKIAVITNIELDHTDQYPTLEDVYSAFALFLTRIPADGTLIVCGDDGNIRELLKHYNGALITYGFSPTNDYVIKRTSVSGYKTFFWLKSHSTTLGEFSISVPGDHNALNATAALVAAITCGVSLDTIKKSLGMYHGSKRRFELVGKTHQGAVVYDDYAHHPTEIQSTLAALRKSYPNARIVCIFQPHTYSRTKSLFDQFVSSFKLANDVIVTNIYPSLREAQESPATSRQFAQAVGAFQKHVFYLPKLPDVIKYIQAQELDDKTILITMGAGDVYKVAEELVGNSK